MRLFENEKENLHLRMQSPPSLKLLEGRILSLQQLETLNLEWLVLLSDIKTYASLAKSISLPENFS